MNITLPLAKSIFYTCKLHQFILDGKDESDEAEAVRGEADFSWYKMSGEEIEIVGQLSSRLFDAFPEGVKNELD